ncbi:hypothetical protein NDA01_23290 [Trichocoleus desertorum AS-A10]|uniref:DUF6602 domain-containing protein n=1 Tax=Trichocoleus desertorum TaxID=1481672 RepID=UPI00329969B5
MYRREVTLEQMREAAAQQTRELREMAQSLSFWMDGVHHPSEGQNLEYVVRSYLRRRIPQRFEVSTGFVSTLEANTNTNGERKITRNVSRQFDILIWDAETFPPLFRADEFVIVTPESIRVIIEVTRHLTPNKLRQDLEKFDGLHNLYSMERQRFRPYTAIVAFSGCKTKNLLQTLEQFYLFDSSLPVSFRYSVLRAKGLDTRKVPIPDFMQSICVLDQGLIRAEVENMLIAPMKRVVRYMAYANEPNLETSFGFFERDVVLTLSQSAAEASGQWEPSVDIYREFTHGSIQKACGSLVVEDWESIFPSLNVMDQGRQRKPESPSHVPNVSKFVGADFLSDHPRPAMYIERFGSKRVWAFERHEGGIFARGLYSQGCRVGLWRLFAFDKDRHQSFADTLERAEESFQEKLQEKLRKFETIKWEDTPSSL